MKITKTDLTNLIRDELENFKIVKLTADDMEQLHKTGQIEKDGVFYQYQEPVKEFNIKKVDKITNTPKKPFPIKAEKDDDIEEGKKIIVKSIPGRKIQLDLENEAQAFIDGLKRDNKKISLKNISDYIDAEYKFFNSPKLNHQVFNYIKKNLKKLSETKLKEGFDLKKLEDAIKMFQKKIKKQGRVTNARDEEHLKQLIKVYKNMGGKRIKESVWGLPKGSNTTNMDELDAELSRAGIKSIPDFTKLIVQVKGNKSKINKIMKTHKAKKIFEGKRQQLTIPVMDKLKTDKILKKLRLKPGKDYDVGVGSRNSFILDIEGKYLDKLITLLMKQRIRVR